jgi:hypothetical protein
MAKTFDLNKIKNEIDSRKNERNMVSSKLGESAGKGIAPRDEFLNGLLTAYKTGKDTPSSTLIKIVENKVAVKHGEAQKHVINETPVQQPQRPVRQEQVDMSPERDEQLFFDLERKRKQTLAESIENFAKVPAVGSPMQNNVQQYAGQPMQINEAYLAENVKNVVNNYLSESLGPIFEEAIKGTIIEMYAIERIKEVLNENRALIREVVIDTIKEIQAANAKKKVQ